MPSNAETNCSGSSLLSLRMSCDRCRTQKLKCSVPADSSTCQRCQRARVSCVFGRRSSSERTLRKATHRADQSTTASTASPEPQQLVTPLEPEPMLLNAPELKLSSCNTQPNWNDLTPDIHGLLPEWDSDMESYDRLQSGLALDIDMFIAGQPDLTPWPQLPNLTSTTSWPVDDLASASNTVSTVQSRDAVLASQRLTTLVSEIQQQLKMLEESRWHTDSVGSLDDYPIGTVLELSQQFSAIAGPILSCRASELEEVGDEENGNEKKTNNAAVDTPTLLLVMCGYIWLVRTHCVVLGHFQKHLNCRPALHPYGSISGNRSPSTIMSPISGITSTTAPRNPTLRLGQLPCADMALSLQQIYTAVGMLLDVLHDIEGHLGRGAAVARVMAATSLLDWGRRHDGCYSGLNKKATSVKELLREKMGL
ncbi:uncharacterized protein LY89DRAFT_762198 [Mollisia scopiformis]|uniref:Zn(2)-C6 fungal-type domain-containing protein n=1 Tax=Mollisia scopiformis TaxID=149040 RepID=A0A194XPQ6_MOLSC|nr:uncharacterized protein LY89DRAFT_762198 [Mollisia scopiformis]KUJ22235.1 hypothetical protein LY89DRAFT_762198 [Mollisia scopiformis]